MKRIFKLIFGLSLSFFFIWLISKNLDFKEFIIHFSQAKISYVFLAIIIFNLGYSFRIQRWKIMMMQINPKLNWNQCAGPFISCVAANNILPFRAGDILRVFAFNKRLNINTSISFSALLFERLLDLLMLLLFLCLALNYFELELTKFIGISNVIIILLILLISITLFFPFFLKKPLISFFKIIFFFNKTFALKIQNQIIKIFDSLEYISKKKNLIKLIFWSFLAWFAEGLVFWVIALSIPEITNNLAAWIALPVGSLSTLIPSSPGYIGTFDYFTANSMFVMNNTYSSSVAYAFIVHIVLWLPPLVLASLYLFNNPINFQFKKYK